MAKGFKHGSGGSNPLNFKVICNPKPENARENTIWVDTDTEITGWAFSASDPSVVSVGCREGVSGHYLNASGAEVSSANWRITDYTKLPKNSKKIGTVFSASATSGRYHAFYDADKNFISSAARKNGTNSFSVPANAVYIRMTVHNNDNMSFNATVTLDEGFVWFPIGTSSPVGFNAVKKNGIQVYPISAKQYVGVEWVEKTAKSYQGGEWVDWFTYLYKQGHKFESITGGWSGFVYYEDYDPGIYTERESSILVQSNTNHICGGCGPEKKIDLTDVSKIVVNFVDTNRNITVFVSSVRSGKSYAQRVSAVDFDGGPGEVVLDVSALVGSYYLIMGFVDYYASNWYYEFDEVRLE